MKKTYTPAKELETYRLRLSIKDVEHKIRSKKSELEKIINYYGFKDGRRVVRIKRLTKEINKYELRLIELKTEFEKRK